MRKILLKKAFSPLDILLGNVAWILFVIPMCLIQCIATTTEGHSKSIQESPVYKQLQMRMRVASQMGAVPFFPGMAVAQERRNKKRPAHLIIHCMDNQLSRWCWRVRGGHGLAQ